MSTCAGSFLTDGVTCLLLGADKQNFLALCGDVADEEISLLEFLNGLLQVNDVDTVSLGENVRSHLGVPSSGLVTEVYACFQQLLHRYYAHDSSS